MITPTVFEQQVERLNHLLQQAIWREWNCRRQNKINQRKEELQRIFSLEDQIQQLELLISCQNKH